MMTVIITETHTGFLVSHGSQVGPVSLTSGAEIPAEVTEHSGENTLVTLAPNIGLLINPLFFDTRDH